MVRGRHAHLAASRAPGRRRLSPRGSEQRGPMLLPLERPPAAGRAWTGPGLVGAVLACRGQHGSAARSPGGLPVGSVGWTWAGKGEGPVVCGRAFAVLRGGGTAGRQRWHLSLALRAGLEVASGFVRVGWRFLLSLRGRPRLGHPATSRRGGWRWARPGGLPIAIPGSVPVPSAALSEGGELIHSGCDCR